MLKSNCYTDSETLPLLHIVVKGIFFMQRTKLKELITQLEELLSELKVEVYADADAYIDSDGEQWYSGDDDDGYAD